jgi:4-amino-4-deoxychorismate lyase
MTELSATVLVDGRIAAGVPADDRGLAYGDGVFETLLLHRQQPVWWDAHIDRLERGAAVLGIAAPERSAWRADLDALLDACAEAAHRRAVVKLMLTRGSGQRGYRADGNSLPRRIAVLSAASSIDPRQQVDGIALRWCDLRLAAQPRLAGIKHLNRLEQVLARAEWSDPTVHEGLLCDSDGAVVCATAANLFIVREGRLLTPLVDRCGIAGTCRAFLLPQAEACRLGRDDVLTADEVFVCNSLRGILPVTRLEQRTWPVGPLTRAQMARLAAAEPAFAAESR